jgi:hypothetical protein
MSSKIYLLKHANKPLIRFSFYSTHLSSQRIKILKEYREHRHFIPLGLEVSGESLLSWIKSRTIPKNRAFVQKLLMELGLRLDDVERIISISKSLSLNDIYWIVEEGFEGLFEEYNLYDHDFNHTLSLLVYTGYASIEGTRVYL